MSYLRLHIKYIILSSILISGCAHKPSTNLTLNYVSEHSTNHGKKDKADAQKRILCKVVFDEIKDGRISKGNLGYVGSTVVHGSNVSKWIKQALNTESREKYKIGFVKENTIDDNDLLVGLNLVKAYAHNIGTTKNTNIVFKSTIQTKTKEIISKIHRGGYSAINWSSSDSEIHEAFNFALSDVIKKLNADLMGICDQIYVDNISL